MSIHEITGVSARTFKCHMPVGRKHWLSLFSLALTSHGLPSFVQRIFPLLTYKHLFVLKARRSRVMREGKEGVGDPESLG